VDQAQADLAKSQASLAATAAQQQQNVVAADGTLGQNQAALQTQQASATATATPFTPQDLAAARAQVANAQAALATAQNNLSSAELVAPVDGAVAQINGTAGQFVTTAAGSGSGGGAGASGFITVAALDQLQVQAQVNESDMAGILPRNPITFTVSAYPGTTFTGSVLSVQPLPNASQNVVTYTVLCSVDPTAVPLLPGMTASVTLVTQHRSDVVLVPNSALQFAQSQGQPPGTAIVVSNGTPQPRSIQTGLSDGRLTEVIAGLQPGEIVATGTTGG
jgi:HlyD family secretion protein